MILKIFGYILCYHKIQDKLFLALKYIVEIFSLVFRKNLLSNKRISYSWYMDKELRKSWDCAAKFRGFTYLFAVQSDYGDICYILAAQAFSF